MDNLSPVPFFPIHFDDDDLRLLTPEELSGQVRVCRAFIRLCLEAGCPTRKGRLSAAELLCWLFEQYPAVRVLCGLPELEPVMERTQTARARRQMANAVITLLGIRGFTRGLPGAKGTAPDGAQ